MRPLGEHDKSVRALLWVGKWTGNRRPRPTRGKLESIGKKRVREAPCSWVR